ncbi:DUF4190 domain-containing protein [Mycolicibacterium neoaurum]|uniref:DUF4190 domain-containing protein n=1 Tax=Mycolicibacterium neoaurum TaxID=1795 RepID=UPI00248D2546|nr:DUF4190 domain-containing protein [Mycolicibacterium neoaurum]WBP93604.1 DUF4190 domain-containing protein [Mycolicibacterium neoaurum]WBS07397.1 DUF4190 domain-containing protein [Mycolicibacterium neoaurum]
MSHPGGDPFGAPQSGDPFGGPPPLINSTTGYGSPGYGAPGGYGAPPPGRSDINTLAVLSPIFGVVLPPVGVVLGHLALPQIRRTGERGRGGALAGLAIGYLMCVVLVALLVWALVSDSEPEAPVVAPPTSVTVPSTQAESVAPSVVTSVAPAPPERRFKVNLGTVPIGACVEIQRRSTEREDALDLYMVDCQKRPGVFTVTQRVATSADCTTGYVAAPPDRSLAVCLTPY